MNKTIIAVYGVSGVGKTSSVKHFANLNPVFRDINNQVQSFNPDNSEDIFGTIQIEKTTIGVTSQGDPGTDIINRLRQLIHCPIIVCTCRTKGSTVADVQNFASVENYTIIWFGNFSTSNREAHDGTMLNRESGRAMDNVVRRILEVV